MHILKVLLFNIIIGMEKLENKFQEEDMRMGTYMKDI